MALTLLFDFEQLNPNAKKNKTLDAIKKYFTKANCIVATTDISAIKRASGVSFRDVQFSFSDSQTVVFSIKQTGDIFKVKVNSRELPIKNQQDHEQAIQEVIAKLDSGRLAFQKRLAKVKVPTPPKMKSTLGAKEKQYAATEAELDMKITEAEAQLAELKGE